MGATAQQTRRGRGQSATPGEPKGTVTQIAPHPVLASGAQLAGAMLAVQGAAPALVPDEDGQVGPRRYRYVTLDGLLNTVMPLLVEHELMWTTMPCKDEFGEPALRYRLTHVPSGEAIEDTMPLLIANPDPQGQGSAITYARRYALMAVLNLAPGDDDDGAAGSVRTINAPQGARPAAQNSTSGGRPASSKQKDMLRAKAAEAGLSVSQFANILLSAHGDQRTEFADEAAAQRVFKLKLERLPAGQVDFVIEQIQIVGGRA